MRIEAWVERIPLCRRCQELEPEWRMETELRSPFHCWGCDSEEAQLVMLERRTFAVFDPQPSEEGIALSFYFPGLHPFEDPLDQSWLRLLVKRMPACQKCTGPIPYGTKTTVSRLFDCWVCGMRSDVPYRFPHPQSMLLQSRDDAIFVRLDG